MATALRKNKPVEFRATTPCTSARGEVRSCGRAVVRSIFERQRSHPAPTVFQHATPLPKFERAMHCDVQPVYPCAFIANL
eukprot:365999-Chlamydomonas_euryale.AAC.1